MKLDFSQPPPLEQQYLGGRIFLDGREIKHVWYVDTDANLIRTYDVSAHPLAAVREDKLAIASCDIARIFPSGLPPFVEAPVGGVASWTIFGTVEVFHRGERTPYDVPPRSINA